MVLRRIRRDLVYPFTVNLRSRTEGTTTYQVLVYIDRQRQPCAFFDVSPARAELRVAYGSDGILTTNLQIRRDAASHIYNMKVIAISRWSLTWSLKRLRVV